MENTKQKASAKQKLTIAAIFGAMGPGLLAALSGNDAGGIATYSSAGASYGYKMLWMLPVMTVLLIVTQETAARCGCVTGKGLASLIRERFGVRKSVLAMAALLIANTAVTISEFAGIASGLALFGVPASISVPLVALLVWMLTMSGSFQRIEKILLLVSCVFVTYIVAAFMAGPNWGEVAVDLVVPNIQNDPSYVSLVVATIGTTIAPWMIFLAQNNVVDKNAGEDDIVLVQQLGENAELPDLEKTAALIEETLRANGESTVVVGIGTVATHLRDLAKSYKEAQMAIEVGKVFDTEKYIISYENLGIGRLIYQLPTTLCEMFLQEVFKKNPIDALDKETLFTINKFFENNLILSETARKLFVHRNTLVYRLEKIKKLTGLDLREFDDAITFKVALMVKKYLASRGIEA